MFAQANPEAKCHLDRSQVWPQQQQQGNRRYQTSPALCSPVTPFPPIPF